MARSAVEQTHHLLQQARGVTLYPSLYPSLYHLRNSLINYFGTLCALCNLRNKFGDLPKCTTRFLLAVADEGHDERNYTGTTECRRRQRIAESGLQSLDRKQSEQYNTDRKRNKEC